MSRLSDIQEWFGTLIAQPLRDDDALAPETPFGTPLEEEAHRFIAPSPTLPPHKRLEIYHQQYWWRLMKCLQKNFPSLARLYGSERFNREIAIPYLSDHPPDHWALCRLGQTLPNWLAEKDLERDLAEIDAAAQRAFWSERHPACAFTGAPLALQPHVHLFQLGGDLFTFREELLKEDSAYWREHPFPEIRQGRCYFVLYRDPRNRVKWKELSEGEHGVLTLFREGSTIEQACEKIETKGGKALRDARAFFPVWFREWTVLNWFVER